MTEVVFAVVGRNELRDELLRKAFVVAKLWPIQYLCDGAYGAEVLRGVTAFFGGRSKWKSALQFFYRSKFKVSFNKILLIDGLVLSNSPGWLFLEEVMESVQGMPAIVGVTIPIEADDMFCAKAMDMGAHFVCYPSDLGTGVNTFLKSASNLFATQSRSETIERAASIGQFIFLSAVAVTSGIIVLCFQSFFGTQK